MDSTRLIYGVTRPLHVINMYFIAATSNQNVPNEHMLRKWYHGAIKKATTESIVIESTNFFDEYFNYRKCGSHEEDAPNAMTLPYFRGEIETILSKLQIEKHIAGARINPSYDVVICNSANKASAETHNTSKECRRHFIGPVLRSGTR